MNTNKLRFTIVECPSKWMPKSNFWSLKLSSIGILWETLTFIKDKNNFWDWLLIIQKVDRKFECFVLNNWKDKCIS